MKRQVLYIYSIAFIISIIVVFGCSDVNEKSQTDTVSYSITFNKENLKLAKVEVTFRPKDSILYMNGGASKLPKRWATFVHNLKVTNELGKSIKIEELSDARWKINTSLIEKINLTYDVHLDHEDYEWSGGIDGVAYKTEMGVFYTGRALLILNGEDWKNINVDFELPKDWNVTTPWDKEKGINNSFTVDSFSNLANSMIFAGTHKEISLKREDFELVFALGTKDIVEQEEEFRNLAEGVLDYYIELMDGVPNPQPDTPFKKAVVVISSAEKTDGEAIGNNISVLIEKDGDQLSKIVSRFIFAHEFFHLWSGKSFSPIKDDTEWFKEGVTNYYTIKALHHVGFLNDDSYLNFLSDFFYQKYIDDKGVGKLSMTNGEKKHGHWGLIYSGGMFVGISQDIIIRNATNNEKSMDNLMRNLFKKYGGKNDNYSIEELQTNFSELSGIDQSDFFNTYIFGTKKIPVDNYLAISGVSSKFENKKLILSKNKNITPEQIKILNGVYGKIKNK